ncbi:MULTISPECIES: hypothetical protein [unclassified Pseudoalteromonas]|jgi:primosomal replication protein N|uniref:hypothetical protein n=1 Tax=unclassified Pseudoalteromonas TaxID=194690 RepID=UPI0003FADD47|nr:MULTISPECIES: hypothetical protein [unclassified Pseudoalteromonas]
MEAIYDYICSPQFVHRLKAVVDHQEQMKVELDKERNAMLRIPVMVNTDSGFIVNT